MRAMRNPGFHKRKALLKSDEQSRRAFYQHVFSSQAVNNAAPAPVGIDLKVELNAHGQLIATGFVFRGVKESAKSQSPSKTPFSGYWLGEPSSLRANQNAAGNAAAHQSPTAVLRSAEPPADQASYSLPACEVQTLDHRQFEDHELARVTNDAR